ncbi:MAG TPA: amidase family protein [Vicinamibacterales bacterium]|nr:amidase family protein [Vicinamibacterales bacterium]
MGAVEEESAIALTRLLRQGVISAREVMHAHLDRIRALNPSLHAIVAKLDDDQCLALADDADRKLASGEDVGPLHGLPWAFKDLEDAVGFPNTMGSQIFKDRMPVQDSPLVALLRRAGVIPIGKTNVPEFGMGSHTYNSVYGTTRNPYDTTKSAGGSSGGAGAALASGMLPLADGSDLGGSLRNPANFNGVVALRPSARVSAVLGESDWCGLNVKGPMGRTVADTAFLFDVMADRRDSWTLARDMRGVRVAWCPDLGGLPLDTQVRAVLNAARKTFDALGCDVQDAVPDLTDADDIFLTIRRRRAYVNLGDMLRSHRRLMKPEAVDEIERGARITAEDVASAKAKHDRLLARASAFLDRYEFLICAVNQVPPFDAKIDWPHEIDGVKMEHYCAWMKSAYWISTTCCPAASVPGGKTVDGLPVGLQIVARQGNDRGVLQMAYAVEQSVGFVGRPFLRPAGIIR